MAEVLLSTLADALGGPVVADATFTATATRARAVGDGVVANKTITVPVVQGVPSEPILLDQSGVDWCWRLRVVFPSIGVRIDRTVAVPDVPSVEWADLVDVDPATLLPAESAVPAWTAAVGQVAAILADTAVARDGAVTAQGLSEAARDAAVLARGIAEIARDGAVVAQGASEDARDQAQVYAANTVELQDTTFTALIADEESATRAQLNATMGAYLDVNVPVEVSEALASDPVVQSGVEDAIDTALPPAIATVLPGAVATEVTTQVTPHVTAAAGSASTAGTKATEAANSANIALAGQFAGAALNAVDLNTVTPPGMYRQNTTANATLALNYPVNGVTGILEVTQATTTASSLIQKFWATSGVAGAARGFYVRRLFSGAWSAWGFVATQRVDQTAGRAIYTWDDVNNREQAIYYDSGLLDVTALLINGWTGTVYLRRCMNVVELIAQNLVPGSTSAFIALPSGFRPPVAVPIDTNPVSINKGQLTSGGTGTLPITGAVYAANSVKATWFTSNQLPSSQPGTLVGSIPT